MAGKGDAGMMGVYELEVILGSQVYATDPVFHTEGMSDAYEALTEGWYFWDEVWAHAIGPYTTSDEAYKALNEYVQTL